MDGVQGRSGGVAVRQVCGGVTCQLTGGTCLLPENVCDGQVDCFGAEDEMNCLDEEDKDEGRESEGRDDRQHLEEGREYEGRDDHGDQYKGSNDQYYDYYYEEEEEEGMDYRSKSLAKDSKRKPSHSSIPEPIPSSENIDSNPPQTIPEAEVAYGYIPNSIPSPEIAYGYVPEAIPGGESSHSYMPDTAYGFIPGYVPEVANSKISPRSGGDMTSATPGDQDPCAVRRVTVGEVLQERESVVCSADEFKCTDLPECVPAASRCDGVRQCADGTDERACGCRARLEAAGRGDLLCDSHPDCPDSSDEEGCETCKAETPFHCARSRQCVKVSQLCDTRKDCTHGEDEMDCLALYNTTEVEGVVEGTLMLKEGTTWHSLCLGRLPTNLGTHVCRYIGYSELGGISYIQALPFRTQDPRRATGTEPRRAKEPEARTEGRNGGEGGDGEGKRKIRGVDGDDSEALLLKNVLALRGEGEELNDGETDDDSEVPLLRKIQGLKGRGGGQARARTCQQAVVRCEGEACGKASLYYYDKVTPVAKEGGVPWAACVQVNGRCVCGGTLLRDSFVLTSVTCMAHVSLDKDIVVVVMGSLHRVGVPTRVLGGHEVERRVGHMRGIEGTDMMLLRLLDKMPKSGYVNSLCLPRSAPVIGKEKRCVVAGMSERDGRQSVGLLFTPRGECQDGYLCSDPTPGQDYCTESWAGLVACQQRVETHPTWEGVGVWVYHRPEGGNGSTTCHAHSKHPLLTDAHLTALHAVMDTDDTPTPPASPLATCEGRLCATGVCVSPSQECDGTLDCPDLSDERHTCSPLLNTCLPVNVTVQPPGGDVCECPEGMWACLSGACIPLGSVCDGVTDCTKGEDEEGCSCCKVIKLKTPEKICDGKLDCDDQGDEKHCGCTNTTTDGRVFRCYRSAPQSCVGRGMVCNGRKDCGQGEDEGKCVTLSPNVTVVEDELGRPIKAASSGYLLVRLAGTWFTYAYDEWDVYLSHLICLQLGYFMANVTEAREMASHGMVVSWDGGDVDDMKVAKVEEGVVDVVWIECEMEMREMVRRSVPSSSSRFASLSKSLLRRRGS